MGCAFSTEICCSITAPPLPQTTGNNGPVRLRFQVREPNVRKILLQKILENLDWITDGRTKWHLEVLEF